MTDPDVSMPDPPKPPVAPAKKRRWPRRLAFLGIALGLLIAAFPALLSTSWLNDAVRGWLKANVDRPVTFGKLDVSWTEGVAIHDLEVRDAKGGEPLLTAPLVEVDTRLWPLLQRRVDARLFVIHDPVLRIRKDEQGVNTEGVVKTRKVRRKRRARKQKTGRPPPEQEGAEEEEEDDEGTALPEIDVPVEVRNLTLVFVDEEGREARQSGISFTGDVTTRDGPTTFRLEIPDGAGGIFVSGAATLFDADGVPLPEAERLLDAEVRIEKLSADANRDVLALFLGNTPLSGEVNGRVDLASHGRDGQGALELTVRGVAMGDAVGARVAEGDDLHISGRFTSTADRIDIEDLALTGEGIDGHLSVAGSVGALEGDGVLTVDLALAAEALRAMGFQVPDDIEGQIEGTLELAGETGHGLLEVTNLVTPSPVEGRPPVRIDEFGGELRMSQSGEVMTIDRATLDLLDVRLLTRGTVERDGSLDLRVAANGDVGPLIVKLRDMGILPPDFELGGKLGSKLTVRRTPGAAGVDVELDSLRLSGPHHTIDATGARSAAGALTLRATGQGELAHLLSTSLVAPDVADLAGRFDLDVTVSGDEEGLAVEVEKLRLDGALAVDLTGALARDGALDARLKADGALSSAFEIARRLGVLEGPLPLEGRLAADVTIAGTRDEPTVPRLDVSVTEGPIAATARGTINAAREADIAAEVSGKLQALLDVVAARGDAEPVQLDGRFGGELTARGPLDALVIAVPRMSVTAGGLTATLDGRREEDGATSGRADIAGSLADLTSLLHGLGYAEDLDAHGNLKTTLTAQMPGGDAARVVTGTLQIEATDLTLQRSAEPQSAFSARSFTLSGDDVQVDLDAEMLQQLTLAISGDDGLAGTVEASGSLDDGPLAARIVLDGPLSAALGAVAFATGGERTDLDGTLALSARASGPRDDLLFEIDRMNATSGDFTVAITGARRADGSADLNATLQGDAARAAAIARAFGQLEGRDLAGRLDATLTAALRDDVIDASLDVTGTDFVLIDTGEDGKTLRDPLVHVTAPSVRYHTETRRVEPFTATIDATGARLEATLGIEPGDAPEGSDIAAQLVSVDGSITIEKQFAETHPELFEDFTLQGLAGPIRFSGDIADGRERAATWSGSFDVQATGVTAPYVTIEMAQLTGALDAGTLDVKKLHALVNGGTLDGTASIGLVGRRPQHAVDLDAKDVGIDADLAPLLARALPLLAIGESGKAGGTLGLEVKLTADGVKPKRIKKSMKGGGVARLANVQVESTNWVGKLLEFTGGGKLLEIADAEVAFTVENGEVVTDGLPISAVGLDLRLGGTVGLDGALDYGLGVKSGSGALGKWSSLTDGDGYLPLRLEGDVSNPKLKLPSVKDLAGGGWGDLLDKLRGNDDEDDDGSDADDEEKKDDEEERKKRRKKRRKKNKKKKQDDDEGT